MARERRKGKSREENGRGMVKGRRDEEKDAPIFHTLVAPVL